MLGWVLDLFQVQFDGLGEVGESFVDSASLAGHIHL